MKVDVAKPILTPAKDTFAVPHVPYIQVYQDGLVVFEESPTQETD